MTTDTTLERLEAAHIGEYSPIRHVTDCRACGQPWPCDASRLLAVARAAQYVNDLYRWSDQYSTSLAELEQALAALDTEPSPEAEDGR